MRHTIEIDLYKLIKRCVIEGINEGHARGLKYQVTEKPDMDSMKDYMVESVMNELCDYILFEDPTPSDYDDNRDM